MKSLSPVGGVEPKARAAPIIQASLGGTPPSFGILLPQGEKDTVLVYAQVDIRVSRFSRTASKNCSVVIHA